MEVFLKSVCVIQEIFRKALFPFEEKVETDTSCFLVLKRFRIHEPIKELKIARFIQGIEELWVDTVDVRS